ncbi:MAG: PhoD-like phosphatase [Elainellaceae cyanobacterium]
MTYFDWFQHLQTCPLILAGPVLRHATFESVAVWIALKHPSTVELTIYTTANQGARLGEPQMAGQGTTIRVGRSLHIAVVIARPLTASLQSDRLYAYDLRFTPQVAPQEKIQGELQDSRVSQSLLQALGSGPTISYFDHQRPTFALPPSDIGHLKMAHGSCRKAHGEGHDALPIIDRLIEQAAASPYHRPHQLFHTGDQIYADDVADAMLAMCSPFGNALLGWTEALPVGPLEPDVAYHAPESLLAGLRADVATRGAGFTGGLREKRSRVTSHLFSLGEFCALYLLMWSPSCWPDSLPEPHDGIDRDGARQWRQDEQALQRFRQTLWRVRRALANVPSYMIFDDHDVSDDWNLNRAWCLRVLGKPLGRRVVQNALHAYALFQGWGNQPARFESGEPASDLLSATEDWTQSEGTNFEAHEAIARYVGMPAYDPETGLPHFTAAGDGLQCLKRYPEAIDWHVVIESHNHSVILLDARLWRGFLMDESPITPPRLLSPAAFEQQLARPLSRSSAKITFVVAPTNVFHLKVIDWIHEWKLSNKRVFNTDVGDAWTINMEALAELITTLVQHPQQVVILSGDIHYSSSVRLTYEPADGSSSQVLLQLTCSSFKNEEEQTRLVQSRLKSWLLPERDRHWAGWNHPKTMTEVKRNFLRRILGRAANLEQKRSPDWWCHLEWLSRQQVRRAAATVDRLAPDAETSPVRPQGRWLQWRRLLRLRCIQDGSEVLGVNNLGVVRIFRDDDGQPAAIAHDLYWLSPWQPLELLRSRYGSELPQAAQLQMSKAPDDRAIARF